MIQNHYIYKKIKFEILIYSLLEIVSKSSILSSSEEYVNNSNNKDDLEI